MLMAALHEALGTRREWTDSQEDVCYEAAEMRTILLPVGVSAPNATVSSRGARMQARGLLDCEVGGLCGPPCRHEQGELDAEDRHLLLLHEFMPALDVAAAASAR